MTDQNPIGSGSGLDGRLDTLKTGSLVIAGVRGSHEAVLITEGAGWQSTCGTLV